MKKKKNIITMPFNDELLKIIDSKKTSELYKTLLSSQGEIVFPEKKKHYKSKNNLQSHDKY